jgi:hypothetical protein
MSDKQNFADDTEASPTMVSVDGLAKSVLSAGNGACTSIVVKSLEVGQIAWSRS